MGEESRWARSARDLKAWSGPWQIAMRVAGAAIVGVLGAAFTWPRETWVRTAICALVGGMLAHYLAQAVDALLFAPARQRDDARAELDAMRNSASKIIVRIRDVKMRRYQPPTGAPATIEVGALLDVTNHSSKTARLSFRSRVKLAAHADQSEELVWCPLMETEAYAPSVVVLPQQSQSIILEGAHRDAQLTREAQVDRIEVTDSARHPRETRTMPAVVDSVASL